MPYIDPRLGRRIPTDLAHVDKYPFRAFAAPATIAVVERVLNLPFWHKTHDQGAEGSCVGHGLVMERAIVNTQQNKLAHLPWPQVRRYNPIHVWNEAKLIDPWPDTNPGDSNGTDLNSGYAILRDKGAQRVRSMKILPGQLVPSPVFPKAGPYSVDPAEGVSANRWATSVDEMRQAIYEGKPVAIGVNWYKSFYSPVQKTGRFGRVEWFLPVSNLGGSNGGHCVCVYGASDARQAFKFKNSWGTGYPEAWIPYATMQRLLDEHGEAAIVTDR